MKKFGIDPEKPYLLFVGRIARQKGIVHLVRAIEFMDRNFQIVLCAGAPDTPEIAKEMSDAVAKAKSKRPDLIWIDEMLDRQLREKFGKAGRKRVEEKFGWPAIAQETKKLYQSLVRK